MMRRRFPPWSGDPLRFEYRTHEKVCEKEDHHTGMEETGLIQDTTVPEMTINQAKPTKPAETDNGIGTYDDVDIVETNYLYFPWLIRGKLNLVQGDSDTGKSTLLYCIGAHVSKGQNIDDVPCEAPGNVMFVTLEDSDSDIKTAFIDSGGDLSHLKRIRDRKKIASLCFKNRNDLNYIEKIITNNDIKFLVFDPIQAYLGGDINKSNETRPQMEALAGIAERTGCAITLIQHTGKDSSRQGIHKGLGSVDIVAASRSLLQISTDPEDENIVIAYTVKNNTASRADTQRAITYQIYDHPGSIDTHGKHHRYHGHAEITGVLEKYNERIHKARVAKCAESGERIVNYDTDPLVLTVRELIKQNPDGLFIWKDELIERITDYTGSCPYQGGKSKSDGLSSRISAIRAKMIELDKIQIDGQDNALRHKPYTWDGKIISSDDRKPQRGYWLKAIRVK